jgi:hypothetical protein
MQLRKELCTWKYYRRVKCHKSIQKIIKHRKKKLIQGCFILETFIEETIYLATFFWRRFRTDYQAVEFQSWVKPKFCPKGLTVWGRWLHVKKDKNKNIINSRGTDSRYLQHSLSFQGDNVTESHAQEGWRVRKVVKILTCRWAKEKTKVLKYRIVEFYAVRLDSLITIDQTRQKKKKWHEA